MATLTEQQLVGVTTQNDLLPIVEVIDSLESTDTTKPLSANQGKVLNEKIEAIPTELSDDYAVSDLTNLELEPVAGDTFETAIGKLHKAILDNEEVTAESFVALRTVIGLNEDVSIPDLSGTTYISAATTLVEAITLLDTALKTVSEQAATISDLEERLAAVEDALTLKTQD